MTCKRHTDSNDTQAKKKVKWKTTTKKKKNYEYNETAGGK